MLIFSLYSPAPTCPLDLLLSADKKRRKECRVVDALCNLQEMISNPDDHCTFSQLEKPTRCHAKAH